MWSRIFNRLKNSLIFCLIGILSFSSLASLFPFFSESVSAFNMTSGSSSSDPLKSEQCSDSDSDKCRTVRVCTLNSGCEDHKFSSIEDDNSFVVDIQPDIISEDLPAIAKNITIKNGDNSVTVNISDGDFGSGITFIVEDKSGKKIIEQSFSGTTESGGVTAGSGTSGESGTDGSSEENITCSSAAGGLGWILCSVLNVVSNFIDYFYKNFLTNLLAIEPALLNTQNGTYKTWSTFRDVANIVFVIFLLVVIFSQITGIGIDNYGIKKSLPKLIAAAILVNLSYFICQLAVDVSNIVGKSLIDLLDSINTVSSVTVESSVGDGIVVSIGEFGVVAGIAGLMFVTSGMTFSAWAITGITSMFVGFFATIISAGASLIFMFFLLSARQAVVVILVALAPLAFVCYMLPNTKNLFDRWLNIGKSMLLLFPACSLAIGGGRLAARIILGSTTQANLFIVLTAMIAEVAPFFFVPSMVRGAYSALGKIGGRIEGFSKGLSRASGGAFLRGRFARNWQKGVELRRAQGIDAAYKKSIDRSNKAKTPLGRAIGRYGTRSGMQDRVMEARKQIAGVEAYKAERELWAGKNIQTKEGKEIRDLNGNLITQGEAMINATINQAQITADAKAQNAVRMNSPLYQNAAAAALVRKDLDENIRSMESLISNNNYSYLAPGQNGAPSTMTKVDPNDLSSLGKALQEALKKDDNEIEISALVNYLSRQGENGHAAVRGAIETASNNNTLSDDARRKFSSNILQYHAADYKNNMRSVFDYASNNTGDIKETNDVDNNGNIILGANGNPVKRNKTFRDYVAQSADSLKQEQFVSMDEPELKAYLEAIKASEDTTLSNRDRLKLVDVGAFSSYAEAKAENDRRIKVVKELAYNTLNNPELASGFKGKQKALVSEIAGDYAPATSLRERNEEVAASDEARTDESRNNVFRGNYSTFQDAENSGIKFANRSYDDGSTMVSSQNYDQVADTIKNIQDGYRPSPDLKNFTVLNNAEGKTQLVAHDDNGNVSTIFDPSTGRHSSPKQYSFSDDGQAASATQPARAPITRTFNGFMPNLKGQVTNRRWDENPGREHILHLEHTPENGTTRTLEINTKTGFIKTV